MWRYGEAAGQGRTRRFSSQMRGDIYFCKHMHQLFERVQNETTFISITSRRWTWEGPVSLQKLPRLVLDLHTHRMCLVEVIVRQLVCETFLCGTRSGSKCTDPTARWLYSEKGHAKECSLLTRVRRKWNGCT